MRKPPANQPVCSKCWYDLRALIDESAPTGTCPECGETFDPRHPFVLMPGRSFAALLWRMVWPAWLALIPSVTWMAAPIFAPCIAAVAALAVASVPWPLYVMGQALASRRQTTGALWHPPVAAVAAILLNTGMLWGAFSLLRWLGVGPWWEMT